MKNFVYPLVILLFMLSSCSKDLESIQLDNHLITMYYDESYQLNASYEPSDADDLPALTWYCDDENVATVDSTGLVSGVRVGETVITVKTSDNLFFDTCRVVITPQSELYESPVFDFSLTMTEVKIKETRTLLYEDTTGLLYLGENPNVYMAMYLFSDGILYCSDVLLIDDAMAEALVFLNERYVLLGSSSGYIIFRVNESVVAVYGYSSTLGNNVMYFESEEEKSAGNLLEEYASKFDEAIEICSRLRNNR